MLHRFAADLIAGSVGGYAYLMTLPQIGRWRIRGRSWWVSVGVGFWARLMELLFTHKILWIGTCSLC